MYRKSLCLWYYSLIVILIFFKQCRMYINSMTWKYSLVMLETKRLNIIGRVTVIKTFWWRYQMLQKYYEHANSSQGDSCLKQSSVLASMIDSIIRAIWIFFICWCLPNWIHCFGKVRCRFVLMKTVFRPLMVMSTGQDENVGKVKLLSLAFIPSYLRVYLKLTEPI